MSDDITFCANSKECKNKKCMRHDSNISERYIPHSFSYFKDVDDYCEGFIQKDEKENDKKDGVQNMILTKGNISIGKDHIQGRKRPSLVVINKNDLCCNETIYASFSSEEQANEFMDILAEFCGAEIGDTNEQSN